MTDTDNMNMFYSAWRFLSYHPMFASEEERAQGKTPRYGAFQSNLYIEVVKVNPATNRMDDDNSKNIKTVVWLECGPEGCHDIRLDCGGDTFEEAIIKLSKQVKRHYGEY